MTAHITNQLISNAKAMSRDAATLLDAVERLSIPERIAILKRSAALLKVAHDEAIQATEEYKTAFPDLK